MIKVQNYRIDLASVQTWQVPTIDSLSFKDQVLKVDTVHGAPFAYVLIDDKQEAIPRNIISVTKNDDAGAVNHSNYLGTAQFLGGLDIRHLFWDGQ